MKEFSVIKNAKELLSHGSADAREKVLDMADRVLCELNSYKRLHEMLKRDGDILTIGSRKYDLSKFKRVYAFTSGKAGNHMARAFESILADDLTLGISIVKIKDENDVYKKTELYIGGHPLPNEEGIRGCQRMIEIADQMGPDDLLLMGLSGGCSSLMGYPVEGITLQDLREATDVMIKSSMWVMDINDVRGHLSRTGRGRLAQHIHGSKVVCFEIWDAVGLDGITDYTEPQPIMGTPVGYDTITFAGIDKILQKYDLYDKLPRNVLEYLKRADPTEETPQEQICDVDYYLVNTPPDLCSTAEHVGKEMGIETHILTSYAEGESKDYGTFMGSLSKEINNNNRPFAAPCFVISAGETTTWIRDNSAIKGHGGPSQEMVAAFALAADGLKDVCLLSIDSEGTDGTTIAAGGLADGTSYQQAVAKGVRLKRSLLEHATYEALSSINDVVITGNTGTNLCDFNVLYIGAQEQLPEGCK